MWREFNPNPYGKRVGDCTVRALCGALGQEWEETFVGLEVEALLMGDMPSANLTWGAYLERNGFRRKLTDAGCSDCYTVRDFCREHPRGVYVLSISGHVVCVRDGDWFDSWDSGDEIPIYYWEREA